MPKEACSTKFLGSDFLEEMYGNLCLSSPSFKIEWVEKDESYFFIDESERKVYLHMAGIKFLYHFEYQIWTVPDYMWVNQNNIGEIKVENSGLDLVMDIRAGENGAL